MDKPLQWFIHGERPASTVAHEQPRMGQQAMAQDQATGMTAAHEDAILRRDKVDMEMDRRRVHWGR
jgi:hypothetical protein